MKDNPFLSDTFKNIWSKHFNKDKPLFTFKILSELSFIKPSCLPIYLNIGVNHTKGISYILNENGNEDFKNKVFLIYDVPTYFDLDLKNDYKKLKLKKLKQYPGFLVELAEYKDFNHYFFSTFSKSTRYKLSKYKKRLESCFDVSYKMYSGEIDKDNYDTIFEHFKVLLEKRFLDKGISNNNLNPKEWNFYYEVAYPLILENKASLFVIYNGNQPIGITLNYLYKNILIDAITVFDIDFEKFHLGSVTIMKLIEWTLDQKIEIFDFSKGYFDYKKRWSNKEYDFEYHLYYDSGSLMAKFNAYCILNYFNLKNYLRTKNINEVFHKFTFLLKRNKNKANSNIIFEYEAIEKSYHDSQLEEINYLDEKNSHLRNMVFDFLYLNTETQKDVTLFQITTEPLSFLISGKKTKQKVVIK